MFGDVVLDGDVSGDVALFVSFRLDVEVDPVFGAVFFWLRMVPWKGSPLRSASRILRTVSGLVWSHWRTLAGEWPTTSSMV